MYSMTGFHSTLFGISEYIFGYDSVGYCQLHPSNLEPEESTLEELT